MKFSIFILFLCSSSTFGKGVLVSNQAAGACDYAPTAAYYPTCYVDLTVAIDMSSYMISLSNIATLTNDILVNFLPTYNNGQTFTAGLAYGASTIQASNYFTDYTDMCQYIHSAQEQATQLGLNYTPLSKVFQTYQIDLLNTGRNYKKVLVLLTATNDDNDIAQAKVYADQLRSAGVTIYIGALNYTSSLNQLGDQVWPSSNYMFDYTNITSNVCSWSGYTAQPGSAPTDLPYSTSGPSDPRSNAIGTPCSTNTKNAWLDIAFVVDISSAMNSKSLQDLVTQTISYMTKFTFGQSDLHTTRAAIITYASDAVTRYTLNDVTTFADWEKQFIKIMTYPDPTDDGVYVQKGLQKAYNLLQNQGGERVKVILLTAAAYNENGFEGANNTAKQIKDDGIFIFTVNFEEAGGVLNDKLQDLASPGYAYISNQTGLFESLPLGLTQVNCICPPSAPQFRVWNPIGKNYTSYADCIWGFDGESLPSIIPLFGCNPGVLGSITSQDKLDFIADNIVPHDLIGKKQFIVGAHNNNGQWNWYGYDGKDYGLGYFKYNLSFNPSPSDQYAFLNNYSGFKWRLDGSGDDARPYLCEAKACDADYITGDKRSNCF